jgi:predicted SAM-dependent methyltransferase
MQRLLNLGCGSRYRLDSSWTNVDFNGTPGAVIGHDLARGIPFPDGTFDGVYHSNLLEHFTQQAGANLMRECFRVLKPGGVCRVAVPDMEGICRSYLDALACAMRGDPCSSPRHHWMMIELCDQLVRHRTGGEMATYLLQADLSEKAFIVSRIGNIATAIIGDSSDDPSRELGPRPSLTRRGLRFAGRKLSAMRRAALSLVLSRHEMQALEVGLFRLHGEPHLWMYDRYSLTEMMREAGLNNIEKRTATTSVITGWEQHFLDTNKDGTEHQPDSLYMEGERRA